MQDRPFLTARSQSEHKICFILLAHRASHITNMVTSTNNKQLFDHDSRQIEMHP